MAQKRRPTPKQPPKPSPTRQRMVIAIAGAAVTVGIVAIAMSVGGEDPAGAIVDRDPATIAAGAELFAATCATCHGTGLRGTETGPPLLHPYYAPNHHADEAFQRAVLVGVQAHHWGFGDMPAQAGLTREDVEKIIAFVRTEQEAAGIFRDPAHP